MAIDNIKLRQAQIKGPSLSNWSRNKQNKAQILYDNDLLKQNLINIIMTSLNERIYNIYFGGNLMRYLFGLATFGMDKTIEDTLIKNITQYEPRVTLIKVNVDFHPAGEVSTFHRSGYDITINFKSNLDNSLTKIETLNFTIDLKEIIYKTSSFI